MRPSVHRPAGHHRLHTVTITVSLERITVITWVGHDVITAFDGTTDRPRPMNTFHHSHEPLSVRRLAWRPFKHQRVAITVADPVDLAGQAAPTAPQDRVDGPFRPPFDRLLRRLESRESMSNQASKSTSPSDPPREAVNAVAAGSCRTSLHPARSGSDRTSSSKGPIVLADHATWRQYTESRKYP